ncbi:helix-turn-helix domain-containing protein [uncultured Sphingomonas sp.]|uniref:helix-turn-helix domain-containing protein n=1 Tax=uncultured Sphingomonas sp. TaxID=158754 RepID=UPI0035C9FC10
MSGTLVGSSRSVGWTSILVDHHRVQPSEGEFETASTPDQTIVVMLKGEQHIEAFADGLWRRTVYEPGTVGTTPGDRTDRLRRCVNRNSGRFDKANLYLPHLLLDEAVDEYRRAGQRSGDVNLNALAFHDPLICHTAKRLVEAMASGAADLYAAATARWLAAHLVCFHSGRADAERLTLDAGVISDRRIARVLEMMSSRLSNPPTLDELAAEAGVSKFHFVRLFREKVGRTPHAFLLQLRLKAAQSMLAATDLDIGTIAALSGYSRSAELTSAFSRRFGTTPKGWREAARA